MPQFSVIAQQAGFTPAVRGQAVVEQNAEVVPAAFCNLLAVAVFHNTEPFESPGLRSAISPPKSVNGFLPDATMVRPSVWFSPPTVAKRKRPSSILWSRGSFRAGHPPLGEAENKRVFLLNSVLNSARLFAHNAKTAICLFGFGS
ncbi:hypothetical protein DIPPA_59515 [Diplonema papillatum]|nr:hypothetical protein DIPPA_59515 [Diplonema papillatum]